MSPHQIVPRPNESTREVGIFQLRPTTVICCGKDTVSRRVAHRLCSFIERETGLSLEERPGEYQENSIDVRIDEDWSGTDHPEAYRLSTHQDSVKVRAPSERGLLYASATLTGRIVNGEGEWKLPTGEIQDSPTCGWRGLLVDPARGYVPLEALKQTVDRMVRAKLNRLHLHLLDTWSYCLESDSFPKLEEPPEDNRPEELTEAEMAEYIDRTYTSSEIAELVTYCKHRGIEIVPEIEFPGHATQVLKKYPELECDVAGSDPSDFTVCAGADATYEFIAELVAEVSDQFPGNYLHIGGDEFAAYASWEECRRCQQRMDEEDLSDTTELFYYFLRRVHDMVESHNRRLIVWNDNIDISESPDIPEDVIVQFWRVALDGHGPVDGCSMQRFLEQGFDVINSYVPAVYVDGPMDPEYLLEWSPTYRPEVPPEHENQVLGSEMTAWGGWCPGGVFGRESYQSYYRRALPSAIPVFADRVWNGDPIDDREQFTRSLTRHVLGPHVPEEFDLFRQLGGPLLPTEDFVRAHADRRLTDESTAEIREECKSALELLESTPLSEEAPFIDAVSAYSDALNWLHDVAAADSRGMFYRHSQLVEFPPD